MKELNRREKDLTTEIINLQINFKKFEEAVYEVTSELIMVIPEFQNFKKIERIRKAKQIIKAAREQEDWVEVLHNGYS